MKMKSLKISFLVLLLSTVFGCSKQLEKTPFDFVTGDNVVTNQASLNALVNGMYAASTPSFTATLTNSIPQMADEVGTTIATQLPFLLNQVMPNDLNVVLSFWQGLYRSIYISNALIEKTPDLTTVTSANKNIALGQAYFHRAFCHFYLTRMFGDIPYIRTASTDTTFSVIRLPVTQVYSLIENDLNIALSLLPDTYSTAQETINRPTKAAALGILAKLYMYTKDWGKVEINCNSIIALTRLSIEPNYANIFGNRVSSEIIFQLPGSNAAGIQNSRLAVLLFTPPIGGGSYFVTTKIRAAFEPGDRRFPVAITPTATSGNFFCNKYTRSTLDDPLIFLRLADVYLMRAEARANLGNFTGANSAQSDVNIIRTRAGLTQSAFTSASNALLAIEQERYVELCFENHRWLDLTRTGRADIVLGTMKPTWRPTAALWPIPQTEIDTNPRLTQNPGY